MIIRTHRRAIALAAVTLVSCAATAVSASASSRPPAARTAVNYCDPFGGCAALHASPATVKRGHSVKLSGAVGTVCKARARLTLASPAFRGATASSFHGTPAVVARASRTGKVAVTVTIGHAVTAGRYVVTGRCGSRAFAGAKLRVT